MLARLLSPLPALSDRPHHHLQNNHPNNTVSIEYPHTFITPKPMKVTVLIFDNLPTEIAILPIKKDLTKLAITFETKLF